jgi:hypothetical protein
VILDVGTTTTAIARALMASDELTNVCVFTNAINIALELEPAIPRFTVVVLGGTLRPLQHSLVDPLSGLVLEQVNVGIVFLGCNGIDPEAGITNLNLPEAGIKQRMLAAHEAGGRTADQLLLRGVRPARDLERPLDVRVLADHRAAPQPPDLPLPCERVEVVPDRDLGDAEHLAELTDAQELALA